MYFSLFVYDSFIAPPSILCVTSGLVEVTILEAPFLTVSILDTDQADLFQTSSSCPLACFVLISIFPLTQHDR